MPDGGRLLARVAVVTGGGQGIGAAYALGLARQGARVAIADVNGEAATAMANKLNAGGYDATGLCTDVSDESSVEAMVQAVVRRFGGIDILVNNAGIFASLMPKRNFWDIQPSDWDRVMQINAKGPFLCARAALPYLKASGRGRIINISSGTVAMGTPGFLHYVSSKGAVMAFTRALAHEVGAFNITVNTIAPGLTASDGALSSYSAEELEAPAKFRAIQRLQVPEDLVGAVVFLASDESAFMTGQMLLVDGGLAMH